MCFFPQTFTTSIPQMIERASCKLYLEIQLLREFGWDSFSLDEAMVLRHSLRVKRQPSTLQEEIWNGKWPWRFSRRRDWGFVNSNIYSTPLLGLFFPNRNGKSGREMESEIVKRQLAFPTKKRKACSWVCVVYKNLSHDNEVIRAEGMASSSWLKC